MGRIGRIIAFTLLGLFIGFIIFWVVNSGYFIQWRQIETPPVEVTELVTSREFDLYVRTAENEIYSLSNDVWNPSEIPEDIEQGDGWFNSKPCLRVWPEFSPLANPPSQIVECIHDEGVYADFFNKHVYILDTSGNIWVWSHLTAALGSLFDFIAYTCIGGFVGLVLGVGAIGFKERQKRL